MPSWRMWLTALLVVFVSAGFISAGHAQHALPSLSNGTELIITDEASEVILGYGTVSSGRLELNLSDTRATMVVLFISPNGSFTTLRGYLGEDKRLWLTDEATQELTNLESLSRTANIALRVSGVAADAFVAGSDDDDRLRPPEQLAQPAARPADSSREAASSRLGIDLADDDDDDNRNQTNVSRNPEVGTPGAGVDVPLGSSDDDSSDDGGSGDDSSGGGSESPGIPEAPATPNEPEADGSGDHESGDESDVAGDADGDDDTAGADADDDASDDAQVMTQVANRAKVAVKVMMIKRIWWGVLLGALLTACVPQAHTANAPEIRNFFFSTDTWGELPFSVQAKQQALVAATLRDGVLRLEEDVPFAIEPAGATVRQFRAVFEVDVRSGVPKTKSGYALQVVVPRELEAVILTNQLTGVSNAVTLLKPDIDRDG